MLVMLLLLAGWPSRLLVYLSAEGLQGALHPGEGHKGEATVRLRLLPACRRRRRPAVDATEVVDHADALQGQQWQHQHSGENSGGPTPGCVCVYIRGLHRSSLEDL